MSDRMVSKTAFVAAHGHVTNVAALHPLLLLLLAVVCAAIAGDDCEPALALYTCTLPLTRLRRQEKCALSRSAADIVRYFGVEEEEQFERDAISVETSTSGAAQEGQRQVSLSDRECEILMLMSSGHSVDETACQLFLSPATVKSHLQRIYRKLGVSDRTAAVAKAIRDGLID